MTQTETTDKPLKESFSELLDQSFQEMTSIEGSVVAGTVLSIEKDMILIDVGLKSEGRVPLREFGNNEENIKINTEIFNKINLSPGGVIVTSKGKNSDFVSRYFTPQSTILEDPATGSSHCSLIPFWSKKLNKNHLISIQLSQRGGKFECINNFDRVTVIGY